MVEQMQDSGSSRAANGNRRPARTIPLASVLVLSLALGGCLSRSNEDLTGSIRSASPDALRAQSDELGKRYAQKPGEKSVSLRYAQVLRALRQNGQAVAVLQAAAIASPKDAEVQAAYGKALVEVGRLDEAALVLANAHSPDHPDWRILSAQGAVADQQNRHDDAQRLYREALQIAPNEPSVLSNMGLSYALSKQLNAAEDTLRQAVDNPKAGPRVRGNLALVLALQGKFKESEQMASRDLSPSDAEANVAYIRQMLSQQNSWRQIKSADKKLQQTAQERIGQQ
jgi:Flp pilus assembly protein TadD